MTEVDRTEDGKRIYHCDGCDATAVAGSDELLEEWTKEGFIIDDESYGPMFWCPRCKKKE